MHIPAKPLGTTARRVMVTAEQDARTLFGQSSVGTESLLIALIQEGDVVSQVFCKHGLELETVIGAISSIMGLARLGEKGNGRGVKLPYSRALDNVMLRAEANASNRDDAHVSTVHMALSLVENDVGIVARVLEKLGVRNEDLVDDLSRLSSFARRVPTAEGRPKMSLSDARS